ncbi:hypothetical protein IEN85_23320 [Pelagicoccus sp. NFK12]|uniref:Uncharacterized protein n=1 Tax=Pelagicoccus enzymogenes TaxID=2773457 RepID=A0A927FFI4_9BACT|nr:hypothetical protein [Pelagicoccus enzymogenes]MBD5782448.1 hypothetical protein [Pelagicoccus enzymogenes]
MNDDVGGSNLLMHRVALEDDSLNAVEPIAMYRGGIGVCTNMCNNNAQKCTKKLVKAFCLPEVCFNFAALGYLLSLFTPEKLIGYVSGSMSPNFLAERVWRFRDGLNNP